MSIRSFSFEEIRLATNDFAAERFLGQGASGKVYKGFVEEGVLKDGTTTVAVKLLYNTSTQVVRQFESEVTMLSKLRHCRVASFLGYCVYTHGGIFREFILVYEYMPGGTVADRLYNRSGNNQLPPLSWGERINISIGAAEGLNYLHTGTDLVRRIIHCDMKSSNILLNDNLESKVSDFGLSKLTPPDMSYYVIANARGTVGYHDPALRKTKRLTRKSDVYSFGVVLLEMLCGRAAVDTDLPRGKIYLTEWAKPLIETAVTSIVTENVILRFVDINIKNEIERDCLVVYVKLVKDCLHKDPKKRPTMFDVVVQLRRALSLQGARRIIEISSDGDHSICSSDGNSIDSDIHYEVMLRARGGIYNSQGSSSSAGSFMVDERIVGSNLEVIEEENFNVNEGDRADEQISFVDASKTNNSPEEPEFSDFCTQKIHYIREGVRQYKNNVDVIFPSSPRQYLGPTAWKASMIHSLSQYLGPTESELFLQKNWENSALNLQANAVSGTSVDNHIKNNYMEWDPVKECCFLIFKKDEKKNELVAETGGDIHSQFVASLPTDDCRFAVYHGQFQAVFLIHWFPSRSTVIAQVMYASLLGGLRESLGRMLRRILSSLPCGVDFAEVYATTPAEIDRAVLMSH